MQRTPQADHYTIADIRSAADIIEEKDEKVTYLGFCKPGTLSETEENWSILKIEQSGVAKPVLTTFKWAKGFCSYNLKWSERLSYNYTFKNF